MSDLTKSLIKVQKELIAPKSNFNNFGKYKYRSAEDILEAAKPLNAKNGLLLTLTDEPILIGEWHYIKATAILSNGEESLRVSAYARESETKKGMDHSQITGTASSYARKYALNGLYLIDDTKDADTDEYNNQNNKQPQQAPPKEIGKAVLLSKYKMGGKTEEEFNKWFAEEKTKGKSNNELDALLTMALQKNGKQ